MSSEDELPVVGRGERLAPGYEAIEHLRRGNSLDVYDAWSHERGCRAIVKTVRPDRLEDRRTVAELLEEGRRLVRLSHPYLVRGYEVFDEPVPAVAMETLAGQTLDHLIGADGEPLDAAEGAQLGLQLASVVGYLHRQGILHLDIKPDNLIVEAGRAKLIDLNVARPPGPGSAGVGTWCYIAPEQARGDSLTHAADVWGIGVTLFEALSGEDAFDGDEDFPQLVHAAPDLGELRPDLPGELTEAVAACLRFEPESRPALRELVERLAPIAGAMATAPSAAGPGTPERAA